MALEPEYRKDSFASTLEEAFKNLRNLYSDIEPRASVISSQFVSSSNTVNRNRFYNAMEEAIGVNVSSIIQNEGIEDILKASTRENVSLIKSIPDEFFKQIEGVVYRGTTQGLKGSSLIREIRRIGNVTTKRANLIARDQSSKLNSNLNQQRQQNLGVEEYIWRISDDHRVRESHRKNRNKVFRWDSPPPETGHPGHDIQCRCIAEPIINI